MTPAAFVQSLAALRSEDAFNPYRDRCETHDLPGAANARAHLLSSILEKATSAEVEAIWVGRDLGYRGGRRTGLAFTDDEHVADHARRWGCTWERCFTIEAIHERSARVVWNTLHEIKHNVVMWNVFPLHPHLPDEPFSNRRFNAREKEVGLEVLSTLMALVRPHRVIAVGRDAGRAIRRISSGGPTVRHPSYGGEHLFREQIKTLYSTKSAYDSGR